ncbi:hypothetical protein GGI07_001780 [Coemansia sp. Benny D115]|nr:hypothetical protein GGI07_001780 [Coemansia sp. Benny D115]
MPKDSERGSSPAADAKPRATRTGRGAKPHVPSACTNCKKAHLACDLQRPCQRCVNSNKCDTCKDVQHKKRGRPRSKDKRAAAGGSRSPMETQMFQFSFVSESPTATAPASPKPEDPVPAPEEHSDAAHLFLTPGLRCLRLEETPGRALLGHSLLSLINRSLADFVSPHDRAQLLSVFEGLQATLSHRLAARPSAYAPSVLGHPPRAVDPNTFQALPLARLLQRVCADVHATARAHLRTASGAYALFDIDIAVGAVATPPRATAGAVLDETYFVCRITRFDALRSMPTPPLRLARAEEPEHKRRRVGDASHDALYLLAEVTDASSERSTAVSVSPQLSAAASPSVVLPSLADMLRSLDASGPLPLPSFASTGSLAGRCISP